MLKISVTESVGLAVILFLEGQITGKWVELLRLVSETYIRKGTELTLDLSKVSFSDRDGVALLQNLAARRATIQNASPFLTQQIGTEPRDPESLP